jgi:hypothetical protein
MDRMFYISLAVLLGVGLALAFGAAAQHHGGARLVEPVTTPEARRSDIATFRERYLSADRSYSAEARAEAARRLAVLEAEVERITQVQFELEIARIVALADNGHSIFFPGRRSSRYNRIVSVRFSPFGEDFYVLRASPENADLLGAQLIAIEDRPATEVRDVARTLQGGLISWRDRFVNYVLESPEQLHALGLIARNDGAAYRFRLANGEEVERSFIAQPADPNWLRANADRWLYPALMEGEREHRRALLTPAQAPWALQDPEDPFRWRRAPEIEALVIDLRRNDDVENRPIGRALRQFEAAIAAERPRNLVLDMRMNGGGDLTTTRTFMRSLPRRVPGRIFVLTSPWTFSAAISSIGYLEQEAPERVIIVGEAVGDRLNFFSEGDIVTLPNARAEMLNATERHDYATGCRSFGDCHGNVRRNPIAVATLAPDIAAPWTIEAYRAGRDPAMDAVAAALR